MPKRIDPSTLPGHLDLPGPEASPPLLVKGPIVPRYFSFTALRRNYGQGIFRVLQNSADMCDSAGTNRQRGPGLRTSHWRSLSALIVRCIVIGDRRLPDSRCPGDPGVGNHL